MCQAEWTPSSRKGFVAGLPMLKQTAESEHFPFFLTRERKVGMGRQRKAKEGEKESRYTEYSLCGNLYMRQILPFYR